MNHTDLQPLIEFCESNTEWTRTGEFSGDHFEMTTYDGQSKIGVSLEYESDDGMIGDHITEVPSISITIDGRKKFLTWGEAVELMEAMADLTGVAMFG